MGSKRLVVLVVVCLVFVIALVYLSPIGNQIRRSRLSPLPHQSGQESTPDVDGSFPDIPIYPDARKMPPDEEEKRKFLHHASWEIEVPVSELSSWYIEALKKDGWMIDVYPAELDNESVQYLEAKKGEYELDLSLVFQKENGQTRIVAEFPFEIGDDVS